MAWCVGYGSVAVSDDRKMPLDVTPSRLAAGRGGGNENSRDDRSSRAVGELRALDMITSPPNRPQMLLFLLSRYRIQLCLSTTSTFGFADKSKECQARCRDGSHIDQSVAHSISPSLHLSPHEHPS